MTLTTTPRMVRHADPVTREKRRSRAAATEAELTGSQRAALGDVVLRTAAWLKGTREKLPDSEAVTVPDWTAPEIREALAAAHRVHALDFEQLAAADTFNLIRDAAGILRHLSPDGSELSGCFVPRCAR